MSKNNFLHNWQPSANIHTLRERATMLACIRQFFLEKNILEVETPILAQHTVTDVYIDSFSVATPNGQYYLQTSPEYHMKRLLASGSGPIYQISKAFRHEESGHYHNPEFSLLEWYRPNFNHHLLMQEVEALLQIILQCPAALYFGYQQLFQQHCQLNPHDCDSQTLWQCVKTQDKELATNTTMSENDLLQWLMSEVIEPTFVKQPLVFVYDYPAGQAALSQLSDTEPPVAHRFEAYVYGIEMANGFLELRDADQQKQRFIQDQQQRQRLAKSIPTIDPYLIAALEHGLPQCAGVALGLDRLLLAKLQLKELNQVCGFSWENA